jgi:hypothetical protein
VEIAMVVGMLMAGQRVTKNRLIVMLQEDQPKRVESRSNKQMDPKKKPEMH